MTKNTVFKWVLGLALGFGLLGSSLASATEVHAGCHGWYSNGSGEIVRCE